MDPDADWYGGRPQPRPHSATWELSSPPPQKRGGAVPNFLAHVYCGKTGGWVKMPLRMEVGLDPGHIVLDGAQLPPPKGGSTSPPGTPIFGP